MDTITQFLNTCRYEKVNIKLKLDSDDKYYEYPYLCTVLNNKIIFYDPEWDDEDIVLINQIVDYIPALQNKL